MKTLPKVYANKIDKVINNTQDTFIGNKDIITNDNMSIEKKINEIFASKNHIYKSRVKIKYKNNEVIKDIVGIRGNNLLTFDNEIININEIIDINKI